MTTSKVAIFHSKDEPFTLGEVPLPELTGGQILVRNEYTTLCRSDLNTYSGKRFEKTPTILGHEIVGRIVKLGPGSPEKDCRGAPLRVGDRVTWAIYASHPESPFSRMGIPQKAEDLFKYGHEEATPDNHLHGGLSEYCVLRRHTPVIRVSGDLPLKLAALINCSVSTVAGAMRLAGSVKDRGVLVSGVGMLGVIACAMCRVEGAKSVLAMDIDPERLRFARKFGADRTVNLDSEASVDALMAGFGDHEPPLCAMDFSGQPETMEKSLQLLGTGGTAIWIGATFPQRDLAVNAEKVVRRVQVIKGLHNYNEEDFVKAVNFMESHHAGFPFEELVSDTFPLGQVNEAFEHAVTSNAYRVGISLNSDA